jgi:DedD protein
LCKRDVTSLAIEGGPGAELCGKLCDGCRGLIQTALHRTEPRTVAVSAGVQLSGAATAYLQSLQSGAPAVVQADTISPGFFEDFSVSSGAPEKIQPIEFSNLEDASFEMHFGGGSPAALDTIETFPDAPVLESPECQMHFDDESSAALDSEMSVTDASVLESPECQMHFDDESSAAPDSEMSVTDASVLESTEHHGETFLAIAPSTETIHSEVSDIRLSSSNNGHAGELPDDPNAYDRSFTVEPAVEPAVPGDVPDELQSGQSIVEAAHPDPWEDPLPAWDYSRTEWPVLMVPPRARSFAKFKRPFAVALILAFGAGFYYLIYPQASREQARPASSFPSEAAHESSSVTATQKSAEPVQPGQSQVPSTPSDAAASEQAQPQQKPIRDSGTASEPGASAAGNAQGRFALQAAAFPTQAGADEFAEKLKSAGLPSYVISADLARRGRWFRVRVGRFNTAEDANRFAGEAQLRAKAAGVSLQLIVSQYERP